MARQLRNFYVDSAADPSDPTSPQPPRRPLLTSLPPDDPVAPGGGGGATFPMPARRITSFDGVTPGSPDSGAAPAQPNGAAYAEGQRIRRNLASIGDGLSVLGNYNRNAVASVANPLKRVATAAQGTIANVGRGLFGAAPIIPDSSPAIRPVADPLNTGSAAPAPAAPVAAPRTPTLAPASIGGAAGGVPTFARPLATPAPAAPVATAPKPAASPLPAGISMAIDPKTGQRTFSGTGATVAAAQGTPAVAATTPAVTPATPALAMPITRALQTPAPVSTPYSDTAATGQNDAERRQALSDLQSEQFVNSIGGLRSRGRRELAGSLLNTEAGLVNAGGAEASGRANENVDAATRAGIAAQNEGGANDRTALTDAGETTRANIGANSQVAVERARTEAEYNRPLVQADGNGNLIRIIGGIAQPVVGPDGKPVKAPPTAAEGNVTSEDKYKAYQTRLKELESNALGAPAEDIAAKRAALQQEFAGVPGVPAVAKPNPAPKVGTVVGGFRFKGGDPADSANWEKGR